MPEQKQGISQAAFAAIGVVIVAVLAVAAALVRPGMSAQTVAEETTQQVAAAPTGEVTHVDVTVEGMLFVPSVIDVPAGNTLVVNFHNTGDQRHDLLFANGAESGPLAPGESAEVDVGVIQADTVGWCTLPGHRQMGMELDIIAVGGDQAPTAAEADDNPGHEGMDHGSPSSSSRPTMNALVEEAKKHDAYPAALEPLPAADGPVTHEHTFEVTESEDDLTEAIVRPLWEFAGSSPGPTLHGRVGDEFVITLVNNGTMGHSIDFHAGETAPDEAMRTIEPGESLEYRFTAGRSGIWMYHCSTAPMSTHIANGMFGAVVIEPEDLPEVDESYVLIQSEFYVDEGEGGANSGGSGRAAADKMAEQTPDAVMFNGRAFQYDVHPLTAKVDDRVRFWVLDVGPNTALSFHIVGTQFDTVWSEGGYSVYRGQSTDGVTEGVTGAQVLPLLAAQGGFVELVAPEPGHYPIVNHIMSMAEMGAYGTLHVE